MAFGFVQIIQEGSVEPQVPRLRSVEKHFQEEASTQRSLRSATPDFLWKLVALAILMRLSLTKAAHSAMSRLAWQEIRVRSGRDDNGEGSASVERGC